MAAREGRPLLLIDLAVPRDIHPDCREIAGVSLHDMDDLQALVERNASGREAEARRAESDPARRAGPLRALARARRTWCRRSPRCASAPTRSSTACWPRTSRAGRRSPRPTASACRRWRGRSPSRLLHEPTLRLKRAAGERRRLRRTSAPCASCSASTRESAPLEAPGRARCADAARGAPAQAPGQLSVAPAEARHARQRAGARPGAARSPRRSAAPRSSPVESTDGEPGDKARFVRGVERALLDGEVDLGVHSAKDLPGELPDGLALVGVPGARGPARRLRRRRRLARRACPRGRGSAPRACAGAPSCSRCGPTSRSSSCAATSTPACASWPRASSTAIVLAAAGLRRLGREGEIAFRLRARRADAGAPARARWRCEARARRRRRRAPPRRAITRPRRAGRADRRARRGRARSRRPATRRSGVCARLADGELGDRTATPGCPTAASGCATAVDGRRRAARGARARRSPSGCSPPARGEILERAEAAA